MQRWSRAKLVAACGAAIILFAIAHVAEAAAGDEAEVEHARTVALCIVGLVKRTRYDPEGFRRVAEALNADVFVTLTGAPDERATEQVRIVAGFAALARDLRVRRDPGPEGIRAAARAFGPHTNAVFKGIAGMLFAQPVAPRPGAEDGTGAYQLLDMSLSLGQVEEEERRRGARYEYLVYARADAFWLTLLPELRLLRRVHPTAVWIPEGVDSDGVNDRMAIVPRRWAHLYFDRWRLLFNGTLMPLIHRACGGLTTAERSGLGAEWLLLAVLRGHRVPVRRFTPVAALACTDGVRPRHARCSDPMHFPDGESVRFRYSQEGSEAMLAGGFLSRQWVWRAARMPWVSPQCFESAAEAAQCCGEVRYAWGGHAPCWSDVYYFWRCCGRGHGAEGVGSPAPWPWGAKTAEDPFGEYGVYVLPGPAMALRRVDPNMAVREPLCWRISDNNMRCADPLELAVPSAGTEAEAQPARPWFRLTRRSD